MIFFTSKLYFRLSQMIFLVLALVVFEQSVYSQKTKPVEKKRTTASKANTNSNTKATNSKSSSKKVDSAKTASSKTSANKVAAKSKKPTASELRKTAEDKNKANADAVKKRAAQQAALEEKRRRDGAIRAAQEKKRAFENSLRAETMANIAKDDVSGEDSEIRRAAINALGTRAGTILVMEAQTGKVLTIINQEWAIRKSFKPCSTIKLVTAVAGKDKNLIASDGSIRDKDFKLNLDDALAYSNNSYFQVVGSNLGSDTMISYAKALGLGQKTGINAEDETPGKLPYGNNNLRIYSHGDDYEVTPLQLGVMVSAISNGGNMIIPQIPRSKVQKTSFRGHMSRKINLPKEDLQGVLPGMIGAAQYGTARRGVDASMGVAGKTGSCIEKGSWVGLFASVAPVANPQYAVVVITRGQNERGKYAAAIAGKIYESLSDRINVGNKNAVKVPLILAPRKQIDASTASSLDADRGDDSDDADVSAPKVIAPEKVRKAVTKPTSPKPEPAFPPVIITVKGAASRPRIVNN